LIASGKASLELFSSVRAPSGQHSTSSGTQDVRYPTEFRPPYLPKDYDSSDNGTTTSHRIPGAQLVQASPQAFEVRPLGFVVEEEPTLGPDGVSMDLTVMPRLKTNAGLLDVTGVAKTYPQQPVITEQQITTQIGLLAGGGPTFLGTFNPPGANGVNNRADAGRTWLLFARASLAQQ
jgi:hypothetical protein